MNVTSPLAKAYGGSPARPPSGAGPPAVVATQSTLVPERPREGKPMQEDDTSSFTAALTYTSTGAFRRQRPGIFLDTRI